MPRTRKSSKKKTKKCEAHISLPLMLTLKTLDESNNESNVCYGLKAIIKHSGNIYIIIYI
jgi:hypothetical protein